MQPTLEILVHEVGSRSQHYQFNKQSSNYDAGDYLSTFGGRKNLFINIYKNYLGNKHVIPKIYALG